MAMMIRFSCPACQRVLRVDEQFAGRQAKCPGCATPVTVPAKEAAPADVMVAPAPVPQALPRLPAAPPPEDPFAFDPNDGAVVPRRAQRVDTYEDADEAGYVAESRADRSGWKSLRAGLHLFQIGVLIFTGAVGVFIVLIAAMLATGAAMLANFFSSVGPPRASSGNLEAVGAIAIVLVGLSVLAYLAVLASYILELIGTIFMVQVPDSTGCKAFPIVLVCCHGLILACPIFSFLCGLVGAGGVGGVFNLLAAAAWLTSTIIMLIFLHKVGTLLQSDALCKQVVRYAIWYGVGVGVIVVGVCGFFGMMFLGFISAVRGRGEGLGAIFMMGLIGLLIVSTIITLLVMYSALLALARDVIRRKALGPASV
jgi:hypothetical protein